MSAVAVADRRGVLPRVCRWVRRWWGPLTVAERADDELGWFAAGGW